MRAAPNKAVFLYPFEGGEENGKIHRHKAD